MLACGKAVVGDPSMSPGPSHVAQAVQVRTMLQQLPHCKTNIIRVHMSSRKRWDNRTGCTTRQQEDAILMLCHACCLSLLAGMGGIKNATNK